MNVVATVFTIAWIEGAALAASPVVTWVSDPAGPNQTVVVAGGGFAAASVAELARLQDGPTSNPRQTAPPQDAPWLAIRPLQCADQCVKFVIPADRELGVYACRVRSEGSTSNTVLVNAPDPWWIAGDRGEAASLGGWVRIFGKGLSLDPKKPSQIALAAKDGKITILKPAEAGSYALRIDLPQDLAPGDYAVSIHNGFGGDGAWREAGRLAVTAPRAWKAAVFNVKDFGPNAGKALLAALKKAETNGGGVVYLPRGRYPVAGRLTIPQNTVLKGEGMDLVSLYWPDLDPTPPELITGVNFGVESLTLYCQKHRNVIADAATSDGVFLRRVRIRANCFFMIEYAGKDTRGRRAPAAHQECGAAVQLKGRNFEVTDCDIYASNYAIHVARAKVGVIARNRLLYGGRGYSIENTDRLIFEDNLISGNNLLAIGNDITTFWTNYCRNIYFAHNRLQHMYGADREMMTLDAAGGAYFGHVASVDGRRLTLAADPEFRDYTPKPHSDWTGAALMILEGTGGGQYRIVTGNQGRAWELDRPWDIRPDATSRISIAPFRGRNLFIGNTFEDGGAFQLYGMALDTIVAENKGARMEGFSAWGLNPHGWGWQPVWFCQFLDNEILEGNGYGHRTASFGTITGDNNDVYAGPLARYVIFRRNVCRNNAAINIRGTVVDALVEHCTVEHSDTGINVQATTRGVLLRENTMEDVAHPLQGDGIDRAVIVPKR